MGGRTRPAVVVADDGLLAHSYPNIILVLLTDDAALVIADLSIDIALGGDHLQAPPPAGVRHQVALAVGIEA